MPALIWAMGRDVIRPPAKALTVMGTDTPSVVALKSTRAAFAFARLRARRPRRSRSCSEPPAECCLAIGGRTSDVSQLRSTGPSAATVTASTSPGESSSVAAALPMRIMPERSFSP